MNIQAHKTEHVMHNGERKVSEKDQPSPMAKRDKMIIVVVILIFATSLQYYLTTYHNDSVFSKIPTGITQPSLQKQCQDLHTEIQAIEERFKLMEPENISVSDIHYYNNLQDQAQKLGCKRVLNSNT